MTSVDNIDLLNIFNVYLGTDRVFIIKNTPDGAARDIIESYLAVILKADIVGVHYPADVCCCCIVVVHRPIRNLRWYEDALSEQPLEGNVLTLHPLGPCEGLVIRNPLTNLSPEGLEAYIRSNQFTGDSDDVVTEIRYFTSASGSCAVVLIPDTSVVSRILNRQTQPGGPVFCLDPYFPTLHDMLLAQETQLTLQVSPALNSGPQNQHQEIVNAYGVHEAEDAADTCKVTEIPLETSTIHGIDSNDSVPTLALCVSEQRICLTDRDESLEKRVNSKELQCDDLDMIPVCDEMKCQNCYVDSCGQSHFCIVEDSETTHTSGGARMPTLDVVPFSEFSKTELMQDLQTEGTEAAFHSELPIYPPTHSDNIITSNRSRNKYRKAQEIQFGLSGDEALHAALELSMSEYATEQHGHPNRERKEETTDTENTYYAAAQGRWIEPASAGRPHHERNKNCRLLQKFQSGKTEDEAYMEAIAKSMSEASPGNLVRCRNGSRPWHQLVQQSDSTSRTDRTDRLQYERQAAANRGQAVKTYHSGPLKAIKPYPGSSGENMLSGSHYIDHGAKLKATGSYEKTLQKRRNISGNAKSKIRGILKRLHVKSYEEPNSNSYVLKGDEDSVKEAFTQILQILLDDSSAREITNAERAIRNRNMKAKPEIVTEYMAINEPEVPEYWEKFQQGLISHAFEAFQLFFKGRDYFKVELKSSDPVYKSVVKLISNTWEDNKVGQGLDSKGLDRLDYKKMRITKIQRIENLHVFEKYSRKRKRAFLTLHRNGKQSCCPVENLPNSKGPVQTKPLTKCSVLNSEMFPQVNEHFFFHGTTEDVVDSICDKGFDFRVGSLKAMYGSGIYGAESPTKADQYADKPDCRSKTNRKMFLIRIILGESYLCTAQDPHKYRRPPCANIKHLRDDCVTKSHGTFDSVIGQSKRFFREFVVYDSDQCYPEYLITYDRV